MLYYTFDYQTKLYLGIIDISDPIKQHDPRIPGNIVSIQPPTIEEGQVAKWNGLDWDVVDIPDAIIPELVQPTREWQIDNVIRPIRDIKIRELQDRVDRYNNQCTGGIETVDTPETIGKIYLVMQQLRDFPVKCVDPFFPIWPDGNL